MTNQTIPKKARSMVYLPYGSLYAFKLVMFSKIVPYIGEYGLCPYISREMLFEIGVLTLLHLYALLCTDAQTDPLQPAKSHFSYRVNKK